MNIETIEKLIDAGYSKADIDAMQAADNAGTQNDKGAGKEVAPPDEEQGNAGAENARQVETPVDFGAAIENLTNTVTTLSETVKAMQDANIKGATGGKPSTDPITDTMKSFIEKL